MIVPKIFNTERRGGGGGERGQRASDGGGANSGQPPSLTFATTTPDVERATVAVRTAGSRHHVTYATTTPDVERATVAVQTAGSRHHVTYATTTPDVVRATVVVRTAGSRHHVTYATTTPDVERATVAVRTAGSRHHVTYATPTPDVVLCRTNPFPQPSVPCRYVMRDPQRASPSRGVAVMYATNRSCVAAESTMASTHAGSAVSRANSTNASEGRAPPPPPPPPQCQDGEGGRGAGGATSWPVSTRVGASRTWMSITAIWESRELWNALPRTASDMVRSRTVRACDGLSTICAT